MSSVIIKVHLAHCEKKYNSVAAVRCTLRGTSHTIKQAGSSRRMVFFGLMMTLKLIARSCVFHSYGHVIRRNKEKFFKVVLSMVKEFFIAIINYYILFLLSVSRIIFEPSLVTQDKRISMLA